MTSRRPEECENTKVTTAVSWLEEEGRHGATSVATGRQLGDEARTLRSPDHCEREVTVD